MNKTSGLVFTAVAFALGVAVIVMGISNSLSANSGFVMLGIGLVALALRSFMERK